MQAAEKWTPTPADSEIPVEIARLSSYQAMESAGNDRYIQSPMAIIGSEQDSTTLDNIKGQIASLRPYFVQREKDNNIQVEVLEVRPDGTCGAAAVLTLREIVAKLHEMNVQIEVSSKIMDASKRFEVSKNIRELQYQDFRYFKYQLNNPFEEPSISIRKHAVVLSMNPLRAVFTADKIYLVAPVGAKAMLNLIQGYLEELMQEDTFSLHLHQPSSTLQRISLQTYQIVFSIVMGLHSEELSNTNAEVRDILKTLRASTSVPLSVQDKIRILKTSATSNIVKIRSYEKLFLEHASNESNLALLNLALLRDHPEYYIKPLSGEILAETSAFQSVLETFRVDYSSLAIKWDYLMAELENAENMMTLKLDTSRNRLLITDMTLATVSLVISIGNFVLGIFGMNLYSSIEDIDMSFFWSMSLLLIVFVIIGSQRLLRFFGLTSPDLGVDKLKES